jgi:D-sedoheptulose 7-phosphate isomerase
VQQSFQPAPYIQTIQDALGAIDQNRLYAIVDVLFDAFASGRTVYTFGNGASAALASHMACDLGKGTATDLGSGSRSAAHRRLRIVSLNDNASLVTALGNDIDYQDVFLEQLKGLLAPDDVVIAVSGSGQSPNVLRALEYAHRHGAVTVGFTGVRPGAVAMRELCDICLQVPVMTMEQIEDLHVICHHMITMRLRQRIADWAELHAHPAAAVAADGD